MSCESTLQQLGHQSCEFVMLLFAVEAQIQRDTSKYLPFAVRLFVFSPFFTVSDGLSANTLRCFDKGCRA